MPHVHAHGSAAIQDSDNEVEIAEIFSLGNYELGLDLADLSNGETVIVKVKGKTRDAGGDTERVIHQWEFSHAQAEPNKVSPPFTVPHTQGTVVSLETDAGSDVTIPWAVYDLG